MIYVLYYHNPQSYPQLSFMNCTCFCPRFFSYFELLNNNTEMRLSLRDITNSMYEIEHTQYIHNLEYIRL